MFIINYFICFGNWKLAERKKQFVFKVFIFGPLYSAFATSLPPPTTPVLGSKQNKLRETCRKLRIEELLELYSTSSNIWVIKDYKSGAAYGTHGAEEKYIKGFGEETCTEEVAWKTKK